MKFITTIVALSFAVLALAAQLPVDKPQENLKRAAADSFGGSIEDSVHTVGDPVTEISIATGGDMDPLPMTQLPM
ncbi:hypothetical protein BJV78DRAFT_1260313 [Lactifluus subvellereus]|nr:hypothetical protein BJV78DRAFT_1287159 [Lactifluus subvellereus]KAI0245765.1 hypothetical protein BJV78DRAFT_1260313 [Lactifluus subvellereus]